MPKATQKGEWEREGEKREAKKGATGSSCYQRRRRNNTGTGVGVEVKEREEERKR